MLSLMQEIRDQVSRRDYGQCDKGNKHRVFLYSCRKLRSSPKYEDVATDLLGG